MRVFNEHQMPCPHHIYMVSSSIENLSHYHKLVFPCLTFMFPVGSVSTTSVLLTHKILGYLLGSDLLVVAVRHALSRVMRTGRCGADGLKSPAGGVANLDPVAGCVAAVGLAVADVHGYGGSGSQASDSEEGEDFGEHISDVM